MRSTPKAFRLIVPALLLAAASVTVATTASTPTTKIAIRAATIAAADIQPGPGVESSSSGPVRPGTLLPLGTAPGPHATRAPSATGSPKTYRVYATREGLVGHTTANGHLVVANDHFVSLPSSHVLSGKGKNTYSVRVCAISNGRCVYEPVWDVGPWNTRDDYWAANRGDWPSLARGTPEAQAAYQHDFHHGKDQFGRQVSNPAGIDLADGAIHDGLGFGSSVRVNVTFLWTGGGSRGTVNTDGGVLHVRSGPSTTRPVVGLAGPYAQLPITCSTKGQLVTNPAGVTTTTWYHVGKANYVSAAYVTVSRATKAKIKSC